jgi:ABC-2 type transport system permease protein
MSAAAATVPQTPGGATMAPPAPGLATRARWALTEGLTAALRVLTKLRHDPASIALTLGAPVVLVLIFGYIFGSAISVPDGGNYRDFLVSGLFATIAANIVPSMVAMARDASRGVVDRFRSLPVSRAAVPFGQAAATSVYGLGNFVLMALCGLIVGWRIHRGPADAVAALLLLAAFQFAATWVGLYLGLVIGKEETAAQASILIFPVTTLSNVFVPTTGMPGWLRLVADWNPISALAAAARQLLGSPAAPANGSWPLEHPVVASLAWTAVLLAVFVPLSTRRYARSPF